MYCEKKDIVKITKGEIPFTKVKFHSLKCFPNRTIIYLIDESHFSYLESLTSAVLMY